MFENENALQVLDTTVRAFVFFNVFKYFGERKFVELDDLFYFKKQFIIHRFYEEHTLILSISYQIGFLYLIIFNLVY